MFTFYPTQALPRWFSWIGGAQHLSQSQRKTKLAHLGRLGSDTNHSSQNPLCQRQFWHRVATNRLCFRFHHHRPLPIPLPLGSFPQNQGRSQDAHVVRFARQHSLFYPNYLRQNTRRQDPRRFGIGTRFFLRSRSRLYRFLPSLSTLHSKLLFFIIRAKRNLDFTRRSSRLVDKTTGLRSDQTIALSGLLTSQAYPEVIRTNLPFRYQNQQATSLPNQQFYSSLL